MPTAVPPSDRLVGNYPRSTIELFVPGVKEGTGWRRLTAIRANSGGVSCRSSRLPERIATVARTDIAPSHVERGVQVCIEQSLLGGQEIQLPGDAIGVVEANIFCASDRIIFHAVGYACIVELRLQPCERRRIGDRESSSVLVTGGTGSFGKAFVRAPAGTGYSAATPGDPVPRRAGFSLALVCRSDCQRYNASELFSDTHPSWFLG